MHIDWSSLEPDEFAFEPTHFDLATGRFVVASEGRAEMSSDDRRIVDEICAAPERYRGFFYAPFRHVHSIERALLFDLHDPVARKAAFDGWWAIDQLYLRSFASRAERKAENARLRARLSESLEGEPTVARRWKDRRALAHRHWAIDGLRREGIAFDPPPWLDAVMEYEQAVERGFRALVADSLSTIDAWLARHLPECHALLRPPADERALDEMAAARPLPEAYRMLYRWHDGMVRLDENGAARGAFLGNSALHSLASAREQRAMLDELLRRGEFADRPSSWWNESWLPLLDNGAGDAWCIDTAQEHFGRVFEFRHDDERRPVMFRDVGSFIEGYAESLSTGLWHVDPNDGSLEPIEWEAWTELCQRYGGA